MVLFLTTKDLRKQLPLLLGGSLCLLGYGYLALQSSAYGVASLSDMYAACGTGALVCAGLWWWYGKPDRSLSLGLVVLFAVMFRLLGVVAFPVLEDDFYRYLWDGYRLVEFGSPYNSAPAEFFDADLDDRLTELLDAINYPEVATVYGPTSQWVFALGYLIAPTSVTALQGIFALADLATFVLLARMAPVRLSMLYGFSPLLIKEFAFTAHPDVLGALLVVLALLCFQKRRWLLVGICAGLAVGVKVFALVVVPFLIGWQWRAWLGFIATVILVALPFGLLEAWIPVGLQAMAGAWLFNAPLYALVSHWFADASFTLVKLCLVGSFACLWGWFYAVWLRTWWHSGPPPIAALPHGSLWAAFFLVIPVLNPWYLVWWLPFAVLRPSLMAWVASVAILLSYETGINTKQAGLDLYVQPDWILLVEFGVIAIAASIDLIRRRSSQVQDSGAAGRC